MSWMSGMRVRLQQLFRRAAAEGRMDEEIRFHIEMETEKNLRAGMSPEEARRRALLAFGAMETHRAELRNGRRLVVLEDLVHDLRYAIRSLRRDSVWTTFAVLIVGLGIGASVTVFSLVHGLLLRPLPFHEPDRLVSISNGDSPDLSGRATQVRYLEMLRSESRSLADVAGYSEFYGAGDHHLIGTGEPERLTGVPVTENFLPLLGVEPQLGRNFTAEESSWGGPSAVILSHAFWARRFASDPDVVGRAITINGEPMTIVGVVPASFDFGSVFAPGRRIDFFSPFPLSAETDRMGNTLALIGRLRPGVTVEAAARELTRFVTEADHTQRRNAFNPRLLTLRERVSGGFRPAMFVLAGAVGLVMLIVCANLSNLLLARSAVREKEMALRGALGAGRGRLVRQLLTESVLLSCAGAALGLLLALAGTPLLANAETLNLPLLDQVRVDWTVLGFAIAMAVLTGLVFGLAPALRVSTPALNEALKDTSRGMSGGRRQGWLRAVLVVSEVALACMLLIGAGLLTRSFLRLLDVELGFRPEGAVAVRIDLPRSFFASEEARIAYYEEALLRVSQVPGVEAAGLTDVLPFAFNRLWGITVPGQDNAPDEARHAYVRLVSEGYLHAMGIALRAGRDFDAGDNASGRPVILVNETLARRLWPGESPLGRMLSPGGRADHEVIGVVADTRHQTLEEQPGPEMYMPLRQVADDGALHVVARGPLAPSALVSTVRAALRQMDATLPMTQVRVIQDLVDRSVSPRRLIVLLLTGFAGFALVLASLGIYGVISYGVAQRKREIGIRIALGAPAAALQRRILLQTLKLAAAGMAVGILASWMLGRVLQGMLFGVGLLDPVAFAGALALLTSVAALAGYLPARRTSRVQPMEVLAAE